MLDHRNIRFEGGVDFFRMRRRIRASHIVYTGPVDAYFDFCFGRLPYRSIEFEHEHLPATARYQEVGTVNFPNDYRYTRITEFRHLTGQSHAGTSIVREYPCDDGDPYYPVPRPENEALFKRYEALAREATEVTFVGRLAQYRYYNMDQCVGAALKAAEHVLARLGFDDVRPAEESTPRVRATLPPAPPPEPPRHDTPLLPIVRTGVA
jgi:UDP-galactopyranose mutase